MTCVCAQENTIIAVDNIFDEFVSTLIQLEMQNNTYLMQCKTCEQRWKVDGKDDYAPSYAIKLDINESYIPYDNEIWEFKFYKSDKIFKLLAVLFAVVSFFIYSPFHILIDGIISLISLIFALVTLYKTFDTYVLFNDKIIIKCLFFNKRDILYSDIYKIKYRTYLCLQENRQEKKSPSYSSEFIIVLNSYKRIVIQDVFFINEGDKSLSHGGMYQRLREKINPYGIEIMDLDES